MNTEILNTIRQIREVISELQTELNNSHSAQEKQLLEKALNNLFAQENILLNEILQAMVDKVNAANGELKSLVAEMEQSAKKIAELSGKIKKISNVIGTLVEITSKAIGAGII